MLALPPAWLTSLRGRTVANHIASHELENHAVHSPGVSLKEQYPHLNDMLARLTQSRAILGVMLDADGSDEAPVIDYATRMNLMWAVDALLENAESAVDAALRVAYKTDMALRNE